MTVETAKNARLDFRYWIPFVGYAEATRHVPFSFNFLENTLLYLGLGVVIRRFTPILIPLSLLIFAASAIAEWMMFSRLKPEVFGWHKLDRQSFVWSAWQAFCFFMLGLLL
jgi:hypothetical protein